MNRSSLQDRNSSFQQRFPGKDSGEWIRRGNDLFLMSPVSTVRGLLWQCPAEPALCLTALIAPWVFCLNLNSSWAGQNPELNRQLQSIHREELGWFFMEASECSSLILKAVITWNSVVSSAFTEKNVNFLGKKPTKIQPFLKVCCKPLEHHVVTAFHVN